MDDSTKRLLGLLKHISPPIAPEEESAENPTVRSEPRYSPLVESLQIAYPNLTAEQIEAMLQEM